ncbi:sialate O-acetylesterase [Thermoflexibacter ruber]|uniref:Sialate O-acetylesterase n=1 Tax=Thermoflexibacter ruber TaxID=1003 RepID=A0A1I2FBD3_9BACT|nr:sialate O-acetylesterase [Thermoflexibacter ruber]SFF02058.1 sialate O-acetylesterase [Thermoflexibacter ruber]
MKKITIYLTLLLFWSDNQSFAKIIMPKIFADGMVLQRDIPVPIWGWADANEKITVTFLGKRYTTKADNNGKWTLKLAEMKAGGAFEMTIQGKEKEAITIKNIMIGEVWIASGQSNMEWKIDWLPYKNTEPSLANFSQIRMFTVPRELSAKPEKDITGGTWQEAVGNNVKDFSAVAYFFAKELYKHYKIPIGIINTSWGGTIAETWISAGAAKQIPDFKAVVEDLERTPDAIEKAKREAEEARKRFEEMVNVKEIGLVEKWWQNDLNTSDWKEMKLPTLWESAGLPNLDGVVWFRKEIEIPEKYLGKDLVLSLGAVDDSDETYFNGEKIGQTMQKYAEARVYKIPANKLKNGKNTLTIRVIDTGGGGGIYGKSEEMFVGLGTERIVELAGNWKYKVGLGENISLPQSFGPNSRPTLLYNAMIYPLVPYAIRGAIWYQGESNAGRAYQYRTVFPALIQDWRNQWKQGDFPFLFVQLANFMKFEDEPKESDWAELREAQTMTLSLPNTGMAVITDIGEANDIHPKNKHDVGKRLALAAKKVAYKEDIIYSSPMYESMQVNGNKIVISFKNIGSGLMVKDRYGYIKGFAIAGEDKKFYWAKAYFDGNKVIVENESINKPVAVRYAWANNPEDANLFSKEGLPVCPFRTDDWQGITYGRK